MSAHALTTYEALYASYRSRRVRPPMWKHLDRLAARAGLAARAHASRPSVLWNEVHQVETLAPTIRAHSDAALDHELTQAREAFQRQRATPEDLRRGLALVREVARRVTGEEAYPVQLLGALSLYHGRIIEMLTGEGKTLTGSIAAVLIAWRDRRLHVFTVNDYLAQRDAQSREPIYARCGLSAGAIVHELDQARRPEVYARSIVYGTPKQITADWLRDQLRLGRSASPWAARTRFSGAKLAPGSDAGMGPMIPGLRAALVDEADAVLIDEGVVPLIIARSRREDELSRAYRQARALMQELQRGEHYDLDPVRRRATLTPAGEDALARATRALIDTGHADPIWRAPLRGAELVRQAIVADACYVRGQQYQVVDGKVVIVDEYTGRFLPDRSWEHGLHQAVEAKEGLDITADRETLARLSFQRFFRTYPFLCGMTGTAADATGELQSVYARPVAVIPTHRPIARTLRPMRLFRAQREKWAAVAHAVESEHRAGRPVLVGTRSISASETLSQLLQQRGLHHAVLNANFDKEEASIIAAAGHSDTPTGPAITVATNMAGRGTDIKLDPAARRNGGLHVILTEVHAAVRIDRQFIGRAGRQGDPGSAQLFVALDDEILRKHTPRPATLLAARAPEGELAGPTRAMARSLVRIAQRLAQAYERRNRAAVLRQDDWIEKHLPGNG